MSERRAALVTGAGTGIGRGIARAFAAAGYSVLACDLDRAAVEETARLAGSEGGEVRAHQADLSVRKGTNDAVAAAQEAFGRLDVLACNAGIFPRAMISEVEDDELDLVLTVNLKAIFWLVQAALPLLEAAEHPRILATTSMGGNRTVTTGLVAYEASKAGATGLIRNLAVELGPKGITVNAVEPGFIATERIRERMPDDLVEAIASRVPMRRTGRPADIAAMMVFLASPEASYVTGQSIAVSGGAELVEGLMPR